MIILVEFVIIIFLHFLVEVGETLAALGAQKAIGKVRISCLVSIQFD